MAVNPIPEGFHTVTPHMVIRGASEAIEFYTKAFGAEEVCRMPGPNNMGVMHSEVRIGDSMIMIVDEMPMMDRWVSPAKLNGTTVALAIHTEDCDALFKRAVDAGATATMQPMDAFWGDRYAKVTDPFGHEWEISTRQEDLTPEQCSERAKAFFANMGPGGDCGQ